MPLQRPYGGPQFGTAPVIQVNPDGVSCTVYPFTYFGATGDDGASVTTALATYNVVFLVALTYSFNTTPTVGANQVVYGQPGTVSAGTAGFTTYTTQVGGSLGSIGTGNAAARSGTLGATLPRWAVTVVTAALTTSGTVYMTALTLPSGLKISNLSMLTGTTTLKTGGTHGWYILCDSSRIVRAATADQTDASTVWGSASTDYTLPIATAGGAAATSFTTTYSGLYYFGVMVANSSGSQPNLTACATMGAGTGQAPVPCGASATTAQTTPPLTDGSATIGAITFDGTKNFFAWVS